MSTGPTGPPLTPSARAEVEALLRGWLPLQRWFAGKNRPIEAVRVLTDLPLSPQEADPEVHHLVVAVTAAGKEDDAGAGSSSARTDVYQVPISLRREPDDRLVHAQIGEVDGRLAHDAPHDKDATALLLQGFVHGGVEGMEFHSEPGADLPLGQPSIVLSAEQSNTSLVYGEAAILKVFRHLSPGLNPDIEIHDALTRAGCSHVADLIGWIEGSWPTVDDDGATAVGSLAMLQRFLVTAADGWELAKTSVRDLYAEGDLHADEVGGDFAAEAHRLGAATAEVHAVMRAALPTGSLGGVELRARVATMQDRLEDALAVVAELRPYADGLHQAFAELAGLADRGAEVPVQRIHGDYHLGQVVRTVLGWKLLDFEGEPAKPLAERVALDSPLRDVAGMLRSFDYAARHLLDEQPLAQLAYRAGEWAARNRDAFCDGYAEAAGRDPREDAVLLRAYETDKAVYEAVYEARNRPSWLPIPLAAVERLAS